MEKYKLKQAVIVEGRYDAIRIGALVDAMILTTGGFSIFRDKEKLRLIQRLAEKDGIIILTDSDAAGFRIRAHLAGAVRPEQVTHVYIPDVYGKERRKPRAGAEGKLGVEGITTQALCEAFAKAGISLDGEPVKVLEKSGAQQIAKIDFMEWGLAGGTESAKKRQAILKFLNLPQYTNANALLRIINKLYTKEEFIQIVEQALAKEQDMDADA